MAAPHLRFRSPGPELLALPWGRPLAAWDPTEVPLRDLPVGPSRHLVRFVEVDRRLLAVKALPRHTALGEYGVLREVERRGLPAVVAEGVATRPGADEALLVTRYLAGSWQYRRLLLRVPWSQQVHRARLFEAMAVLLVDLHRNGVFWGDCSLANTLFTRDGRAVQAWLVDAETAEAHPALSDGQRALDLEQAVENVAGGLLDVAARRAELGDEPPAGLLDEALGLADRYRRLWDLLFDAPVVRLGERERIGGRLRQVEAAGFQLDEVRFDPVGGDDELRMEVRAGGRQFHAERLRRLTGLEAGEGQAAVLLEDLDADRARRAAAGSDPGEAAAAQRWRQEVFAPAAERASAAAGATSSGGPADPVQAYCDLLEVRWLLSEQAGRDVGDDRALSELGERAPPGAAAGLAVVDRPTRELPRVPPGARHPGSGPG